jgi:carnitine O-acetyltransferase
MFVFDLPGDESIELTYRYFPQRSVTLESAEFVSKMGKAVNSNPGDLKEKRDLLQKATAAHANYSKLAAKANGVDRHLFGLSQMLDNTEKAPALFSDPVFSRSKRWRLSTSNLSHPRIVNWGFGQVCPDGVGIGYSIHPNSCVFHIAALAETGWTPKLATLLDEALREMQHIAQSEPEQESLPPSKL